VSQLVRVRVQVVEQAMQLVVVAGLTEDGATPDGRLFVAKGYRQGPVSLGTYTRVWRQARERALNPAQQRSPLAKVPYHLRHAAVSLWLNAGVPATQVAEWAGQRPCLAQGLRQVHRRSGRGGSEADRSALSAQDDQGVRTGS
jgi:hypothetical protein